MKLTLDQANTIISAALERASAAGYRPMGVVVLDEAGHCICAQRQDGATMFRLDIATGKAWATVAMGAPSRNLRERANAQPAFFNALATISDGRFVPQIGTALIKDSEGNILGAVGASGGTGEEDEEICIAGVKAAGFAAGE
jgi:uncharacterized protein GlcG (DUF336 family)